MNSAPVSRGFLLERLSDAGIAQPEKAHLIGRHPKPFIFGDMQPSGSGRTHIGCHNSQSTLAVATFSADPMACESAIRGRGIAG